MSDLRYPIGPFAPPADCGATARRGWINDLEELPQLLSDTVHDLDDSQLDTPYRPGGWTARQLVHHVPDSHLNAYVRIKLALTEEEPTIRVYDQDAWAKLADSAGPIAPSLALLAALHQRWTALLRSLDGTAWERRLRHPELGLLTVATTTALYSWHSRHHLAHLRGLRQRQAW